VPRGSRLLDLVLVLITGIAIGLAIAALVDRLDPTGGDPRLHTAHTETVHTTPRIISDDDVPVVLHRLDYAAHGGVVRVEWYDGAWAPLAPDTGCYVTLYADDRPIASALLGGRSGENQSRPGSLVWVGRLGRGAVRLEIRVERADTGFAIPDAAADRPVADGLLVTEWE
jgi:hypothetical protein